MSSHQLKLCELIQPAQIDWRDGLPYSTEFDDIYFSPDDGLAESEYVFIDGCKLGEDWRLSSNNFQLLELGFGSGLNFLLCAKLWQQIREQKDNPEQWLNYQSIEIRPFSKTDFLKAAQHWAQVEFLARSVAEKWPAPIYGKHRLNYPDWHISLDLIYMPVDHALASLTEEINQSACAPKFDHIFLDGFAPAKNPQMWQQSVTDQLARLSKTGTKIASFSVAAIVKNALNNSGFSLEKRKGFGRKREMLLAKYEKKTEHPNIGNITHSKTKRLNLKYDAPWLQFKTPPGKTVAIVGAGIAGCTLAHQLTAKGFKVTLFDAGNTLATQASGSAAGIFHPQITGDFNIPSQLHWFAYQRMLEQLSELTAEAKHNLLISEGVNRRFNADGKTRASSIIELAHLLKFDEWVCNSKQKDSVFYPQAAALDMARWCEFLVNDCVSNSLRVRLNSRITNIRQQQEQWILEIICGSDNDQQCFDHVVLCTGAAGFHLSACELNKLFVEHTHLTRGQITSFNHSTLAKHLRHVLCDELYLVPEQEASFLVGSTFEKLDKNPDEDFLLSSQTQSLFANSQRDLIHRLNKFLESQGINLNIDDPGQLQGKAGYRLHTKDRLPLCGPAPDMNKVIQVFSKLGKKRIEFNTHEHFNLPGLWLNCGYGSHGLLLSMLNADILTSMISGQFLPVRHQLANAQHPVRFLIQQLKNQ